MNRIKLLYLDVCTLCRPFDDQTYLKIKLETEAVNLILLKIKTISSHYRMVSSPVHFKEIEFIPDEVELFHINALLNKYSSFFNIDNKRVRQRAEELTLFWFGAADAAHVAFAEELNAEFISCDEKLIKKCRKYIKKIWCGNPLNFCEKENLK